MTDRNADATCLCDGPECAGALSVSGGVNHRRAVPIGTKRLAKGYVMVKTAEAQGRLGRRWYAEHRLVMEAHLGRPLLPRENVHHINGMKDDNRLENLELWVRPQTAGQRVADLVSFVVANYPDEVRSALGEIR